MNSTKRKARAKNKAKQLDIQRQDRQNSRAYARQKQGEVDEAVDKYIQGNTIQCWNCEAKVKAERVVSYGEQALYYHCEECNSIEYKTFPLEEEKQK